MFTKELAAFPYIEGIRQHGLLIAADVDPEALGSKLNVARVPLPVARDDPVKENPITLPLSALNDELSSADETPFKETPPTVNWNPPRSKFEEYSISTEESVALAKLNEAKPQRSATIHVPLQSDPGAAPLPPHSPHSSTTVLPKQIPAQS